MTAPTGNAGPNRDLYEQRFNEVVAEVSALRQRGKPVGWPAVPLYPRFGVASGVYTQMATAVNVGEQTLWAGSIGYLSLSYVQVHGVWGLTSGTNTTRYRLKISGTTVGTWDEGALVTSIKGAYSVAAVAALGTTDLLVTLTAQSLTGTGNYACQVIGCHLRPTS